MDRDAERAWTDVKAAVVRHLTQDGDGGAVGAGPAYADACASIRRVVLAEGGWTHAVNREAMGPRAKPGRDNLLADPYGTSGWTIALRAAHLAYVTVTAGYDALPAGGRRIVREALERTDVLRRYVRGAVDAVPVVPAPTVGPWHVAVRFPYLGPGPSSRGRGTVGEGNVDVVVDALSPCQAPVVARLRTHDDGWLDLRLSEAGFLRPVTAPGEWRPLPFGEFAGHVADCPAWVDNPLLPKVGHAESVLGLDDVIDPGRAVHRNDDARKAEEALAVRARAARLRVVDGIVHVLTGAPSLHLASRTLVSAGNLLAHRGTMLAWSLEGDVDMFTEMRPDRTIHPSPATDRGHLPAWAARAGDNASAVALANVQPLGILPSFGLGDVDAGLAALAAYVDVAPYHTAFRVDDLPVSDVDPDVFPSTPLRLLDEVRAYRDAGHPVWRGVGIGDGDDLAADLAALRAHVDLIGEEQAKGGTGWFAPSLHASGRVLTSAAADGIEAHLALERDPDVGLFRP